MIIRKPYAFLIKHFRLLNFILSLMMAYLVLQTVGILNFLNDYLSGFTATVEPGTVNTVFYSSYLIVTVIVIVVSLIGFGLMKYKDKPSKLYLYSLITYLNYFIFYMLSYSTVKSMEITVASIKELKIYRDLAIIFLLNQVVIILFSFIRSTGFNLKKFDFKNDLNELEINTKDNEEVEISVNVDSDKFKRNFKRNIRHFKYTYVENKTVILSILAIIIVLGGSYFALDRFVLNRRYHAEELIHLDDYDFEVIDSYMTNRSYSGKEFSNTKDYLVVRIRVKTENIKKLSIGNFYLTVNNKNYHHRNKYDENIADLGQIYNDQEIGNIYSNYLLIFEIPQSQEKKSKTLYYSANNKKITIDIDAKKIDAITTDKKELKVGEGLALASSVLRNSSLTIKKYDIQDSFEIKYNKIVNGEEYEYKEYIKPKGLKSYQTTILKLSTSFTPDEKLKDGVIKSFGDIVKYYGKINYKENGVIKELNTKISIIETKHGDENDYYIEIPSKIKDSEVLDFVLDIRNKKYVYHLK